jgi:predicted regulator of Ras-like GTPase activity (Roadblock/LC7/MglB family)
MLHMDDGKCITKVSAEPIISSIDDQTETAILEVKGGNAVRVIVETENSLIASRAGPKALFVVLTKHDIPLMLILLKMEDAARKISRLVS